MVVIPFREQAMMEEAGKLEQFLQLLERENRRLMVSADPKKGLRKEPSEKEGVA